ncbi:Hydroxyproline O-galactosyltransferase galt6 [Ancistrocladus abbreviatus]
MKRNKFETVVSVRRLRAFQISMGLIFLYFFLMTSQFPLLFNQFSSQNNQIPIPLFNPKTQKNFNFVSNLVLLDRNEDNSSFFRSAMQAWQKGGELWSKLSQKKPEFFETHVENRVGSETRLCPLEIALSGAEFLRGNGVMELPCGLILGSHVTVVGKPRAGHLEDVVSISGLMEGVMVSQFIVELKKVNVNGGGSEEELPRILHFNPRMKGDWSGRPVIEVNSCYRRQWGTPVRCEGWRSRADEETVDGQVRCDKWIRDDDDHVEELKPTRWFDRLIQQRKMGKVDWPYPFSEDKFFVLAITAGFEGYHISVDGRHVASFPYRTGFDLEDATGLHIYGDVDIHSVYTASLPRLHPSFSSHRHLEMSAEWQAPHLPDGHIDLFIGIISAGDHFAERMAIRKSWLQHNLIRTSTVVARFLLALHERETINVELIKEAEYFGDIVIVPYMDDYSLVVLKTLAICEYGVNKVSADYIMKSDDDTFVRVDAVINEAKNVRSSNDSFFLGKMNYYHKPLRKGKWAVTYEEWPEYYYPPYSDGPGYILTSDIARFIVSEFKKGNLSLFKMEDVSMGMWVQQFSRTEPVEYFHDSRFCQSGCVDGYYTAHYQSPKQMICLWLKLQVEGKPTCCNMR